MITLLGWTRPLPAAIAAAFSTGKVEVVRIKGFDYLRGTVGKVTYWDFPDYEVARAHPKQGVDGIPHWSNEW